MISRHGRGRGPCPFTRTPPERVGSWAVSEFARSPLELFSGSIKAARFEAWLDIGAYKESTKDETTSQSCSHVVSAGDGKATQPEYQATARLAQAAKRARCNLFVSGVPKALAP